MDGSRIRKGKVADSKISVRFYSMPIFLEIGLAMTCLV